MLDLTPIEARYAATSEGPWGWRHFGDDPDNLCRVVAYPPAARWDVIADDIAVPANAEFMAAAHTDVPALVAEVKELRTAMVAALAWIEDEREPGAASQVLRAALAPEAES